MRVARRPRILLEARLSLVERHHIDDSVVFAGEDFLTNLDPACINNVTEQVINVTSSKGTAAIELAFLSGPLLVAPPELIEPPHEIEDGCALQIQTKNLADPLCFLWVDDQPPAAGVEVVAQNQVPARPFSFLARGNLLVAGPLRNDLALELGKAEQNMQCQAAKWRFRIELLRSGDEAHAVLLKKLHHLGEVNQRTAQTIDLVNNDAIDLAGLDVSQQLPHTRPFHVRAGVPAVAVLRGDQRPAFVPLAEDERFSRLALRIERVELLVQAL